MNKKISIQKLNRKRVSFIVKKLKIILIYCAKFLVFVKRLIIFRKTKITRNILC